MKSRRRSVWAIVALLAIGLAVAGQNRLSGREFVLDGVVFLSLAALAFVLAMVRSGPEAIPEVWPRDQEQQNSDPTVPLAPDRWRPILLGLVLAFAATAFLSLAKNRFTSRGVICWWGAVLAWLLANARVQPGRLRMSELLGQRLRGLFGRPISVRVSWAALAMVCILALSLFFHVYRVGDTPAEAQSDHVEASEDVRSILHGQYMIFFPRNTGREATQFYLTAGISHITGYSFFTLKLTMALVGALNVIPMFFLGRELLGRRFGLLAAFFMAVSYWHIIVSRIGWRIVLAPFWTTVTLYLLLRAFRTRRRNDFLLTGLSLGAGLYGYMSFRVTPLLVVILFVLEALLRRRPDLGIKPFLTGGALLVGTSILVYLPMLRYMVDEPRMLWYRVLTRTTDLERPLGPSALSVFANNVKRALQMFNWMGDGAWTASLPNRPALDDVSAALFVLGAAMVLYLLLVKRRPIALYLLVSSFVVLLPSTLAIAFPIENPSNIRASGVIPLVVVLVSLPIYLACRQVVRALRGGTGLVIALAVLALLLGQTARLNYRLYYEDYDRQYRQAAWNASDMARVMQGFVDSLGSIYDTYIIGTAYWVDHRAVALTLRNMEWNNLIMDMREAEPHLLQPRNRLYLFNLSNLAAESWLREHYPQGTLMRFQAFIPEKDFMIFLAMAQP